MKHNIKRILSYVKENKWLALITIVCMLGEVILEMQIPTTMGNLIDEGISTGNSAYVLREGGWMVLYAVLSMILGAGGAYFGARAANGLSYNLRTAIFGAVEDFSFKNTDKFTTPSLVTRLTQDITYVQQAFMMSIRMAMRSPAMLILAAVKATRISGDLSLVLLCAVPLLGLSLGYIAIKTYPRFRVMLHKYDDLNAAAQENLIGIRVVKSFVREPYESAKYEKEAAEVRDAQFKAEKLLIWNGPLMSLAMYGCIIAVVLLGGQFIARGQMESGQLIGFISYISSILMALMMISMYFVNLVMSSASMTRIVEVLDEIPAIPENRESKLQLQDGSVDFDHVYFSYKGDGENPVLSDIDLHIQSGQVVGIIGGSGSGKTSLVQLIPRLYEVDQGAVRVGGHNVKEYSTDTLRDSVGMVPQKNVLFSGTIKENLRWGNEHATDEEIEYACRAACAHDFIKSFPKGYDTDLGQGGVNVSGGQKQRICIARALLKKPKILILDDSTSAVDTMTDESIRRSFKTMFPETTKFIIAQRIQSVKNADKIIVLDEGRVADVGTHEELLARSPIYKEVYESQNRKEADA